MAVGLVGWDDGGECREEGQDGGSARTRGRADAHGLATPPNCPEQPAESQSVRQMAQADGNGCALSELLSRPTPTTPRRSR
jgi:hypothetical protein